MQVSDTEYGWVLSAKEVKSIAAEAVKQALSEDRAGRKYNRSDTGTGSAVVGEILKTFRTRCGWTQKELAERAGIHPTTIGKIESGERGMSLHTFSRIAQEFYVIGDDFIWQVIDEVATWQSS
jgi:DNA-binding XRE family transcriptional regulator